MCDEVELGEERQVAPGLWVARRSFVSTLATLFALTAPSIGARAKAEDLGRAGLSFEEFLAEANPLARQLVSDSSPMGQDRLLLSLASVATRLLAVPIPEMRESGQGETAGSVIGANPGGDPFNVLHWQLEPGARIRPHAHTYGIVVTLGLEGMALVENFEVIGDRDFTSAGPVRAVRTKAQRLIPGGINLVSLERDYVHGFTAGPNGARGLDITTRLRSRERTPYLIIPPQASRDEPFTGQWSLDDPRRV